jgi:hypothetical protein
LLAHPSKSSTIKFLLSSLLVCFPCLTYFATLFDAILWENKTIICIHFSRWERKRCFNEIYLQEKCSLGFLISFVINNDSFASIFTLKVNFIEIFSSLITKVILLYNHWDDVFSWVPIFPWYTASKRNLQGRGWQLRQAGKISYFAFSFRNLLHYRLTRRLAIRP